MRGRSRTAALALAATLVALVGAVAIAHAEEAAPTRDEYVAKVDPICQKNTDENKRILKGASGKVNAGKLAQAGNQFTRAAAAFGKSVREISAVPRPPADSPRLEKWFGFLKIIQTNLGKVGKALKEGNKVRAVHEKIRAERSSNAANNVSFVFGFKYCHLQASQFK
jgi:hypothetical protein